MSDLISGILNLGTHAGWISRILGDSYLMNAKSILWNSTALSLKYDDVVNLINQYDKVDKTSMLFKSATTPGTSAYYIYNVFVILAKVIYTNLLNGLYNTYYEKLEDGADTGVYAVNNEVTAAGKLFFIFIFNYVKEKLKGDPFKLKSITYSSKNPQDSVTQYINENVLSASTISDFISQYKEYKNKLIQRGGGYIRKKTKKTKKTRKTRKNKSIKRPKNKKSKKYNK